MDPVTLPTVFTYIPHTWDFVDKFEKWHGLPFISDRTLSNGLKTIKGHREKFRTFAKRAESLFPELIEERKILDQRGYSNGNKLKEFTGIFETLVCELYSCLDGLRYAIYSIYKNVRGVQKKSTEKLFKKAVLEDYGEGFPANISEWLKLAYESWFLELRTLRSELTHGRVGICSMDEKSCISYIHYGLKSNSDSRVFRIGNTIDWINLFASHVNTLLNTICQFWFNQLEPNMVWEMCGVHQGRAMMRAIEITEPINQDSGLCLFRHVFEEEQTWICPIRDSCSAYDRVGGDSRAILMNLTSRSEKQRQ